jgi:hypothetical protein
MSMKRESSIAVVRQGMLEQEPATWAHDPTLPSFDSLNFQTMENKHAQEYIDFRMREYARDAEWCRNLRKKIEEKLTRDKLWLNVVHLG